MVGVLSSVAREDLMGAIVSPNWNVKSDGGVALFDDLEQSMIDLRMLGSFVEMEFDHFQESWLLVGSCHGSKFAVSE